MAALCRGKGGVNWLPTGLEVSGDGHRDPALGEPTVPCHPQPRCDSTPMQCPSALPPSHALTHCNGGHLQVLIEEATVVHLGLQDMVAQS